MCEGMVQGSIERAMTDIYDFQPFPSLFRKAAALLYSIIVFHPYVDGNKRTATVGTALFLGLNGYEFNPPVEEAIRMAVAIANQHVSDTVEIAKWVRKYSKRRLRLTLLNLILKAIFSSSKSAQGWKELIKAYP